MSYLLKSLLFLLLLPLFLILLFISIPVMMLITFVTTKIIRVQTFSASWPPKQEACPDEPPFCPFPDETVQDVNCKVISSTIVDEFRERREGMKSMISAKKDL